MNVMRRQIKQVFTDLNKLKMDGIHFSGEEWKGEYKEWYDNGPLFLHNYFRTIKNDNYHTMFYQGEDDKRFKGEYKRFNNKGILIQYIIFNDDGTVKKEIL